MIKVTKNEGESLDKLIRRFSKHVKSRRLPKLFRSLRNFTPKPTKAKVRSAAIAREKHRRANREKQFLG